MRFACNGVGTGASPYAAISKRIAAENMSSVEIRLALEEAINLREQIMLVGALQLARRLDRNLKALPVFPALGRSHCMLAHEPRYFCSMNVSNLMLRHRVRKMHRNSRSQRPRGNDDITH